MTATFKFQADATLEPETKVATILDGGEHYQEVVLVAKVNGSIVELVANEDGYLVPMTHIEDAIHKDRSWYIESFTTLGSNVGVDDKLYVKMVTPAAPTKIHFRWEIVASGILETNFYEGASGGMANGADVTPLNSNRSSEDSSDVVITSGVTVATSKGLKISTKKVGGTGFKSVIGGSADRSDELVLKPATTYFREFISTSESNVISLRASWIEE